MKSHLPSSQVKEVVIIKTEEERKVLVLRNRHFVINPNFPRVFVPVEHFDKKRRSEC